MSIHVLPANRPAQRFYRGGTQIARFRNLPDTEQYVPEDWVASTTTVFGDPALGLTSLSDGTTLADSIARDPERWLGPAHVAAWGADSKLLVKLLDAGQRLPVHAHPDTRFAHEHLLRPHGKAEAWHILSGGEVHLGLTEDVPLSELAQLVEHQRTDELLSLLHRRTVAPGDTVFVPPGVLHAIGQDVFLAEVQEPEDLSILLEWQGFALDGVRDGHLGLGFPTALQAVEREHMPDALLESLISHGATLPSSAEPYFRIDRRKLADGHVVDAGFCVAIVVDGEGGFSREGVRTPVRAGDTVLLEHAGGPVHADGRLEIVELRPPAPVGTPTSRPTFEEQAIR